MLAEATRQFVQQRAGGACEHCHLPDAADDLPFHVDHVVVLQHGGTDAPDNLSWACSRCNLFKGPNISTLDSSSSTPIPLFHPRRDDWDVHFRVEAGRIVGLTATGRATVRLLVMNAFSRIDLRRRIA